MYDGWYTETIAAAATIDTDALAAHCARLPNWRDLAASPDVLAARCLLVRMTDDAMVGAGMPYGSSSLVMTKQEFSPGDIVLAHTLHSDLIRRFVTQDRPPYISVRPDREDSIYRIIPLGPDSESLGRVVGVVHLNGVPTEIRKAIGS